MDKDFWVSLAKDDYKIPDGHTLANLTDVLFSYLGSTDPELRDDIAYIVYANWLKREMYSSETLKSQVDTLLANLEKGIGETESDTVFLRAFSVLLLAEIVHNDNKKPILEKKQTERILAKGLWYLDAEKDPRGHIPVKGWAHALAHTADLILVLARSRNIEEGDLWTMLTAVSGKIVHATNHIYIHGEDDRLASAVLEILRRGSIPFDKMRSWTQSFIEPEGRDWKGVYVEEERNRAFQNTRNLLRSIYLQLFLEEEEIAGREQLSRVFLDTLQKLKPY